MTVLAADQNWDQDIVHVVDVESGRDRELKGDEKVTAGTLALSPDGKVLASGGHGPTWTVHLWELATGKHILLLKGHECSVTALAWSPDGRIVGSGDQHYFNEELSTVAPQTVRLWDTATGKELACFGGLKAGVTSLAFSPDGAWLANGLMDSTILIWPTGKALPKLEAYKLNEGDLEARWSDLAVDDASNAHQALWTLVAAPRQSVDFFRKRLQPVAALDTRKIQEWITELDSDKYGIRQAAAQELEKAGLQAQAPIRDNLKRNPTLEKRRRLEQILHTLSDVPSPETVRTIRAIMVLERIASPEAQRVLEAVARGAPGARETEESKASLERLARRASKVP